MNNSDGREEIKITRMQGVVIRLLCLIMLFPFDLATFAQTPEGRFSLEPGESIEGDPLVGPYRPGEGPEEPILDITLEVPEDDAPTVVQADNNPYGLDGKTPFNPNPERAVWLSVLCPGAGQIYNRRYWKLPIIVGGFMGLGYATTWNAGQFQDYSQAYRDIMDDDPSTDSYKNFFPPTTDISTLDPSWLQQTFKSRKDYYRRNRDLCIIGLVAVYLVCIVDAYVDASLAHFDISPNLAMDWGPTLFPESHRRQAAIGLNWALTF